MTQSHRPGLGTRIAAATAAVAVTFGPASHDWLAAPALGIEGLPLMLGLLGAVGVWSICVIGIRSL